MSKKVLVLYASKYGSTKEMAERIGQTFIESGMTTTIKNIKEAESPEEYDVIIIGSAVYVGKWRGEASKYLKKYQEILARKKVWFFSSGPTGVGDPQELTEGWKFPAGLADVTKRINPVDIALFHGAVDIKKLGFLMKWMVKKVKAPIGDFRKWDQVDIWAANIAEIIKS